jgi:hypothetical protein
MLRNVVLSVVTAMISLICYSQGLSFCLEFVPVTLAFGDTVKITFKQ